MSSPLAGIFERLEAMAPERQTLVLHRLRSDGYPVPGLLRVPAEALNTLPPLEPERFLPPDVTPQNARAEFSGVPHSLMLTGATGFLGGFLLGELLKSTNAQIHCLVRCRDSKEGERRIRENQERLWGPRPIPEGRVITVPGDLSKPRLGMSEGALDALAAQTQLILHCGALVNFLNGYDAFIGPNVVGTQEVLRFACRGRLKPLHYISSLAMFMIAMHPPNRSEIPEGISLEYGRGAVLGYGQSKWVCESILDEARGRGFPIAVHRPGLVIGHSETGVSNPMDLLYRTMASMAVSGNAPQTAATIEVIPVDVVTQAIVASLREADSFNRVYHYRSPSPCAVMPAPVIREAGYNVQEVSRDTWVSALKRQPKDPLFPLVELFEAQWPQGLHLDEILSARPTIGADQTFSLLERHGVTVPPMKSVLIRMLEWMQKVGAIPSV